MHPTRTIGLMIALTLASFVSAAQAQSQGGGLERRVQAAQEPAPAVPFRARPAAERTAAVRRMLGAQAAVDMTMMNAPFALTPRRIYIQGRGYLEILNPESMRPQDGNEGAIRFRGRENGYQQAIVHLWGAAGKRFLVDCTVKGDRVRAATDSSYSTNSSSAEVAAPNGGLLSIVTGPQDSRVVIRSAAAPATWFLYGCEITRIQ